MVIRASLVLACLLFASAAAAETIYKYRGADGQMTYSNRRIPNAELVEVFDYKFSAPRAPAASGSAASQAGAESDARMKKHLAALDVAWANLQGATRNLAAAEARLAAGVAPQDGDNVALGGPEAAALSPADVGGPQPPAPPVVGGPQPPAAPGPGQTPAQAAADARQVGGPMGTRRGGGRNAEYFARVEALEADVAKARARLDAAQLAYNQLR